MDSVIDHAALWRQRFEEAAASGLATKKWCLAQGFTVHQYYYWNGRFRALDTATASAAVCGAPSPSSRSKPTFGVGTVRVQSSESGWLRIDPSMSAAL